MACPYLRPLQQKRSPSLDEQPFGCGARPVPSSEEPLNSTTMAYLCNDEDLFPYCRHHRRAESSAARAESPTPAECGAMITT